MYQYNKKEDCFERREYDSSMLDWATVAWRDIPNKEGYLLRPKAWMRMDDPKEITS